MSNTSSRGKRTIIDNDQDNTSPNVPREREAQKAKIDKPRPIIIFEIGNKGEKRDAIRKLVENELETKVSDDTLIEKIQITFNNNLLIYPTSIDAKKSLIQLKIFEKKKYLDLATTDNRPILIVKGISYDEFNEKGLNIKEIGAVEVKPMLNKLDDTQYKMTKLIFDDVEMFKKVLNAGNIKIGYFVYKVEKFGNHPLQCHNCKQFGHIAARCENGFKCSKCSGDHQEGECDENSPIKCVNCGQEHSAYSRECQVFKNEKQAKNERQLEAQNMRKGNTEVNNLSRSYSSMVSSSNVENKKIINELNDVKGKFSEISNKLDKFENCFSSINSTMQDLASNLGKFVQKEIQGNNEKMFYFVLDTLKTVTPTTFASPQVDGMIGSMINSFNHRYKLGIVESEAVTNHLKKPTTTISSQNEQMNRGHNGTNTNSNQNKTMFSLKPSNLGNNG
jgi:hypothetical protein